MDQVNKELVRERNAQIALRLTDLCAAHGSLVYHLSGEGVVAFERDGNCSSFVQQSFCSDMGCLRPIRDGGLCNMDMMFRTLRRFNCVPVSGVVAPDDCSLVPTEEEWEAFLNDFTEIMNKGRKDGIGHWSSALEITRGGVKRVVVTLSARAISNQFVTGILIASDTATYITQIEELEAPSGKGHAQILSQDNWSYAVCDDDKIRHLINTENTVLFIPNRTMIRLPQVGDHLLYDEANQCYIVISDEDFRPIRLR